MWFLLTETRNNNCWCFLHSALEIFSVEMPLIPLGFSPGFCKVHRNLQNSYQYLRVLFFVPFFRFYNYEPTASS